MKTLAISTFVLVSALAGHAAFADCPINPDGSSPISDLGADVGAAKAAAAAPAPVPECTTTLDSVIAEANTTPAGQAFVQQMLGQLSAQTGLTFTPAQASAILANPSLIDNMLIVTPAQAADAAKGVDQASAAKGGAAPMNMGFVLPQKVDFAAAAAMEKPNRSSPSTVFGNVQYGDPPSDPSVVSDAQLQASQAMAEIMTRLSLNTGLPAASQFSVNYKGKTYNTLDGFDKALAANGNTINTTVNQRIANFIDLSVINPNGQRCDVKAALSMKTGYSAPDGTPITVPATHSSLVVSVHGPDANTSVAFFQGIDGTGFFPLGASTPQAWVGGHDVESYSGANALKAVSAAGLWTNAVTAVATQNKFPVGGYGRTGICDDSISMIQQMITGRTTIYPLTMDHDLMAGYLNAQIAAGGPMAGRYTKLLNTLNALPSDTVVNSSAPTRIVDSIPFDPGSPTSFDSLDLARKTLGAAQGS